MKYYRKSQDRHDPSPPPWWCTDCSGLCQQSRWRWQHQCMGHLLGLQLCSGCAAWRRYGPTPHSPSFSCIRIHFPLYLSLSLLYNLVLFLSYRKPGKEKLKTFKICSLTTMASMAKVKTNSFIFAKNCILFNNSL